jgi:hypothetical protein
MKKQLVYLLIATGIILFLGSCEYDFIQPEPAPPPPDPTDTIYFSTDVVPIWDNNNCTNCHKPGGVSSLDLTADNAYNSLTSKGLYNVADPASSKIYTFPHPTTGDHSYKYANETEADIILQWITQGALNN